jgi:hypothetical protein
MKKLLFVFVIITAIACNSEDKTAVTKKEKDKYEQTKETLEQTEKKNPLRFITVELEKDRKNLIGQWVVKGEVKNNATVAAYKDIEVEISYYSKTGAFLMSNTEMVYEEVGAGKTENFKNKDFAPKGTDSVSLKVLSAKTVN